MANLSLGKSNDVPLCQESMGRHQSLVQVFLNSCAVYSTVHAVGCSNLVRWCFRLATYILQAWTALMSFLISTSS